MPEPGWKQKTSPVGKKKKPLFLDKKGRDETSPKLRQTDTPGGEKSIFVGNSS